MRAAPGGALAPRSLAEFCDLVEADGEENPAFSMLPMIRGGLPRASRLAPPTLTEGAVPGVESAPVVDEAMARAHFAWLDEAMARAHFAWLEICTGSCLQ